MSNPFSQMVPIDTLTELFPNTKLTTNQWNLKSMESDPIEFLEAVINANILAIER